MLKKLALALCLAALVGCNSPDVVGTPAYHDRVRGIEDDVRGRIERGEPILVFRTTARIAQITLLDKEGTLSRQVQGPVVVIETTAFPRGEELLTFSAVWQTSDERFANHRHSIEYWNGGRLVTTKSAEGPGAFTVSMRL